MNRACDHTLLEANEWLVVSSIENSRPWFVIYAVADGTHQARLIADRPGPSASQSTHIEEKNTRVGRLNRKLLPGPTGTLTKEEDELSAIVKRN
jgi:hypothetical protein